MKVIQKILGLFHKGQASTSVEGVILHGLEETSPLAKKLVSVLEVIADHPPTTPVAIVFDAGIIIAILDPGVVTRIESALDSIVDVVGAKLKATPEEIKDAKKEVNDVIDKEFNAITPV